MVFVVDDLAAWLVGLLADAGRKKLTTLVLGGAQERALRQAAVAVPLATPAPGHCPRLPLPPASPHTDMTDVPLDR